MHGTKGNFGIFFGGIAAALLLPGAARAMGPQYQIVTDPVAGTLNDVVALTSNNTLGSGSVIGVSPAAPNGSVTLAILTNQHVASGGITLVDFGQGNGVPAVGAPWGTFALTAPLTGGVQFFTLNDGVNNPNNLSEDLAIVQAQINPATLAGAALAEWNLVAANPIHLTAFVPAPPAATPPATVPPNSAAANVAYTQVGYGLGAVYDTASNAYIASAPAGIRRFQNNSSNTVFGASVNNEGGYFEPMVTALAQAPSANGGGLALSGDSGSPFLTQTGGPDQEVVPSFNDPTDPENPDIPEDTVNVNYTDYESAVYWGRPNGGLAVGTVQGYIPLISTGNVATGSLNWAQYYAANPTLVPEPTSFSLLGLGGLALLRRRRR